MSTASSILCYFFEHNLSNGIISNYFHWFKFLEPTSLGLGGFFSFPVTRACISAKHVSNFWWNGRKSLVANWSWSFRPFSNIVTYNDRMFAEKSKSDTKSGKREKSPVQMDVTLLANNFQHYWMLHVASVCTPCCIWNRSKVWANNSEHFFCSVIAEALRNNVGSVCTALPTVLGPRTRINHGLQSLMGCILPTMHYRSQHRWESLHPLRNHCQHGRNNSQHC